MFLSCLLSSASMGFAADEPSIRPVGDPAKPTAVEVVGLTKQQLANFASVAPDHASWADTFALYVRDDSNRTAPLPIAGVYSIEGTALRFTPRYSLRPGLTYRAIFRPRGGDNRSSHEIAADLKIPDPPPAAPTRVVAIYPSASTLPDNQLRFYLHFSAPMSAGEAYTHVKLLNADGTEVTRPFLEIGEELWDGTGQRLTLLFDPGRVKKGLAPRELFGPVLHEGRRYRLVIDKAWRDANGNPLAAGFEKSFAAGAAVETAVDAKKWRIESPLAGTRNALVIQFDRPLDRACIQRMINVAVVGEKVMDGEIAVASDERRWEFRPGSPWRAGKHELVVDTTLEDNAGNNIARPFEVDVFEQVDKTSAPELIRIPFNIQSK